MPDTSNYPIGTLAEVEVWDCACPDSKRLVPAVWAYSDDDDTEGWLTLDDSGVWWFDPCCVPAATEARTSGLTVQCPTCRSLRGKPFSAA